MKFSIIFLLILHQSKELFGANILAIQTIPCYSHQINHYSILKKLADNGHNLTVISIFQMDFGSKNVTQHVLNGSMELFQKHAKYFDSKVKEISALEYYFITLVDAKFKITEMQLEHPIVEDLFHNKSGYNFDILITECSCIFTNLAEIYDCPIVFIYSSEPPSIAHSIVGNGYHSSAIPDPLTIAVLYKKMNLFQRVISYLSIYWFTDFWFASYQQITQQMLASKFPALTRPSQMTTIAKRIRLFLTITSKVTAMIRPTVPNYHQVGFLTVEAPKNLTDLSVKKYLDSSTSGVIVMSFGTLVGDISDKVFERFLNVFKELPFSVVWKMDPMKFQHIAVPKNVLLLKWLQLSDILAHPNVKLLIGHGGLRTIEETVDRQVPILVFPFILDQYLNSDVTVEYGFGKSIDLNRFTKESLLHDIMEMMKVEYKNNIKKFKSLAYDNLGAQLDEAVDNIEHLIKHKDVFHFQDSINRQDHDYSPFFYFVSRIITRILRLTFFIFDFLPR